MTLPTAETDWTDLFAGYALGNLSEEEFQQLEAHLAQDPQLARELFAFQEAFGLLAHSPSESATPPLHLKDTILYKALHSTTPAHTLRSRTELALDLPSPSPVRSTPVRSISTAASFGQPRNRRNQRNWPVWTSASIAAAAITALGVTQVQLQQQIKQTTALQQQVDDTTAELSSLRQQLKDTQTVTAFLGEPSTQVHSLVGTESEQGDSVPNAKLFTQTGNREIVLVTESLPQLPTSQVYRLWAVADDSALSDTIYCGQFRQNTDGTARWAVPDQSCTASPAKLLVTLDAPSDPITSAGPLVLASDA